MMKKLACLLFLLLAVGGFLKFAWPNLVASPARQAEHDFVAKSFVLACDSLEGNVNARQILDKALEKLSWKTTQWLKTKIRQTVQDTDSSFVAEGFLQRGPNYCAHLAMHVQTDGASSRCLVVSDGELLAQERTISDNEPVVVCENVPTPEEQASADLVREAYLAGKGCGGPLPLLQQLSSQLQNVKLQTGLLRGVEVVRLKGELPAQTTSCFVHTVIPLQCCCVYLDAKTLWPHRIEWWGVDKSGSLRCVVQMEYHDALINQELALEECVRLFSYEPKAR